MIKKKIFAVISAAAALSLALSGFTACKNNKCDHVYNWTTLKPATCSSEGEEEGLCGICGDVITRVTEINPDNHGYGDWDILKPTESAAGTAVKTCSYNSAHKYEVELPALTAEGTGYTSSEVTTAPKPLEEGVRTFVLANDTGDISFTVSVPARGIQTVEDAVEVGASFKHLVRRTYGRTTSSLGTHSVEEVYYEFGKDYTHIIDNVNKFERWYTLDGKGKPFGVRVDGVTYNFTDGKPADVKNAGGRPAKDPATNDGFMDGYGFAFYYTGSTQRYYGTENLLTELYKEAKASSNNDFYTKIETEGNETVYKFGFGRFSSPYYSEIKAQFTLTAEYAVKNLTVHAYDYDNTFEKKFEYNEEKGGYATVDGVQASGVEYIEYVQTTLAELSAEEAAEVPVSPYDEQSLRVKSFEVKVGSTVVDEQNPFRVNADTLRDFEIANVENFAEGLNSLVYDPLTVYLRTSEGDEEVTINTLTQLGVLCNYRPSEMKLGLRIQILGEVTLVIKTQSGSFEKVIKLNVEPIAPTSISPQVYVYSDAGYTWSTSSTATVAVGQQLRFRALADAAYKNNRVTVAVTSGNSSNVRFAEVEGSNDWTFTASAVGSYTVTMTSVNGNRTCRFTVTVRQIPTVQQLFGGTTYTGQLQYPRGTVTLTCAVSDAQSGKGTVTVTNANNDAETLSFTYVNGVLTTSHLSGAQNNFTLSLNEAYDLVLSHPTGFGEEVESVIISTNN